MGKSALPTPSPPLSSFVFVLLRKRLTKIRASNIATFKSTSRYLDDLLNIGNEYFEEIADTIYPEKLQLNKTNTSYNEALFLDLNLSIPNDITSIKTYDKRRTFILIL